ncbi:MAG: hypothetical protein COY80_00760 [Candidatus Pacebacteria bacterium CG_4_10_14_0_8_um_filter_42_14]|nr:MAG: hypothetical protein COY80_00760 [Candidatus Pacebacteria bacterium CG_4_10_14_0_8_um_filter_42_14]
MFRKLLLWWLSFTLIWGLFRLLNPSEVVSELLAKPVIWLGIMLIGFKIGLLPRQIIIDLKEKYLQTKPVLTTLILPALSITFYFLLINFRSVSIPQISFFSLVTILLINFATGIVEEVVYRGILYVWLLKNASELTSFLLVQLLFLIGHLPILIIHSDSFESSLTRALFIVLIGSAHTLVFRFTKSLYASSLTHGIWNSLVNLFMLS